MSTRPNNIILAKAGTSSPSEIKLESQPADPLSLYGLTGVGLAFRLSGGHRNLGDMGKDEPSQPSEIKYEFEASGSSLLYGLTGVGFEFRRFSRC